MNSMSYIKNKKARLAKALEGLEDRVAKATAHRRALHKKSDSKPVKRAYLIEPSAGFAPASKPKPKPGPKKP
jgi:hypothetical protein